MPSKRNRPAKSARQMMKSERKKEMRRQRLWLTIILGLGGLLLVAILVITQVVADKKAVGEIITVPANPRPQAVDNTMGDPNAPVKITQYSDFQCPFCKQFSDETEQQIIDTYVKTGKVYYEYVIVGNWVSLNIARYYGTPEKTESIDAGEAAYCAGDQGKFWEYHDMLYANYLGEDVGSYTLKRLEAFADALGLDNGEFMACMQDHKYTERAQKGFNDALDAGVDATPYFFINETTITGAMPFASFQEAIEKELAAAAQK